MCVLNELCKPAIGYYETYVNTVVLNNLLQKDNAGQYRHLRKRQEPVIRTIFFIQKEMKPQFSAIRDEKDMVKLDAILEKGVSRLKRMEFRYMVSLSTSKKEEILEEKRELCRNLITYSFLRYEFIDDKLVERKEELKRPTFFLEKYVISINNGLNYFQTLVESSAKDDEYIKNKVKTILDSCSDTLLGIESYSKKLKVCKPYEGFDIYSTGKWKITIFGDVDKEKNDFELSILCLQRKKPNLFYPYEFMVICIDFEMESGGAIEDEAYVNLRTSFNLLFKGMRENYGNMNTIIQTFKKEMARETIWKDTFNELFRIGRRRDIKTRDEDYQYHITGVTNE
jgi:hypothetical protein